MIRRSVFSQSGRVIPRLAHPRSAVQSPVSSLTSPLYATKLTRPYYLSSRLPAPTKARILSRWYSQDAKPAQESTEAPTEAANGDSATAEASADDALKKDLEAKNKEIVDLKDKYLRQVAEFRNLQERTKREVQSAKDFAIQRFARDLVESVDNFDIALSTVPAEKLEPPPSASSDSESASDDPNKDLRQLYNGLRMTETVLINTLKKHGLERFDPSANGDKFDPNLHEATFQTPQPDKEDGTVFYTTQKGFILNGRVLRAAKVGVVKNS